MGQWRNKCSRVYSGRNCNIYCCRNCGKRLYGFGPGYRNRRLNDPCKCRPGSNDMHRSVGNSFGFRSSNLFVGQWSNQRCCFQPVIHTNIYFISNRCERMRRDRPGACNRKPASGGKCKQLGIDLFGRRCLAGCFRSSVLHLG